MYQTTERAIPDEFKDICDGLHIAVGLRPFPNPGDPFTPMRLISFKNYSNINITVQKNDQKRRKYTMPAYGELQIMLAPGEQYPTLTKGQ
jgi:hypothetical protein